MSRWNRAFPDVLRRLTSLSTKRMTTQNASKYSKAARSSVSEVWNLFLRWMPKPPGGGPLGQHKGRSRCMQASTHDVSIICVLNSSEHAIG